MEITKEVITIEIVSFLFYVIFKPLKSFYQQENKLKQNPVIFV